MATARPKKTKNSAKAEPERRRATTEATIEMLSPSDAWDDKVRDGIRLAFLLHDVSRMRRSAYDQYMKPIGITRAQWWVLAHLSRHDGMMQTQLAALLEVGKASLGDVIEGLERDGWVTRRPDPSDKRAKRVFLTKASQGLIKRMTAMEQEFNEKTFADLSREQISELTRSLSTIKHAIARLSPDTEIGTQKGAARKVS